ncbi:FecR domain-containing protein [Mucilaginibacter sp. ZT4R22]|uniref:FecR domain-containing protein n=1 Tax=Mucilaginibacter pankratovii TaxID=2772110 RepID=A0ABR7X0K0_9SPHI|nr:FecR domain-containing protein [Mucilaginibacter pankratovii]MBD1367234.1 FecR domain-containing protein [Mucilaginibacter pankratovii]
MEKIYFLELLAKHRKGLATAEEKQFLIKFYDAFASEMDVIELMGTDEKQKLKQDIQNAIWGGIQQQQKKNAVVLKFRYLRKVAAAVFVMVCATCVWYLTYNRHPQNSVSEPAKIQQSSNVFVVLPDGSRVILSHGSKLNYEPGFAKREVFLSGQAYFDIKHDSARPFIVHTGNVFTTVLGTAFNIKALPGDKVITVTVTRGKVKVSDERKLIGVIIPNQQIIYNKSVASATKTHIKAAVFTGWTTENDLYLEDVTVAEAARLFEERFKVKIVFGDDSIKNKHFTTSFDSAASLDQALGSTCAFNDAVYSYNKERTLITINAKTN